MKTLQFSILSAAVLFGLVCCRHSPRPANQTQRLVSPSGQYLLTLPIEENTRDPRYAKTPVWKVTIHDRNGAPEYKDEDSTMVGSLNVYWAWDKDDRVWVFNSDDGRMVRWEKQEGGWIRTEVPKQEETQAPDSLLPDYAR